MTQYILHGPKLKIERANSQFIELERAERQFFSSNPPNLVIEEDALTGNRFAKLKLEKVHPDTVYLLAGELIYHLRSAFDQVAVAFAKISATSPNIRGVYFPTGDSRESFENRCDQLLSGFDTDLADLIRSTNAYDGGDDAFRAVFRMANVDKHLELIPVAATGNVCGVNNFTIENAITGLIVSERTSLYEGIVLSELGPKGRIFPNNPTAKLTVNGQFTFGDVSIYEGQPVVEMLRKMVQRSAQIYNQFVEHFDLAR